MRAPTQTAGPKSPKEEPLDTIVGLREYDAGAQKHENTHQVGGDDGHGQGEDERRQQPVPSEGECSKGGERWWRELNTVLFRLVDH